MAKKRSQKSRLTPHAGTIETASAPSTAGHHTQCPLSHVTLDWHKCKCAPCFTNTDSVPFFAKSWYCGDNHGTGAEFVTFLPFRHGKRASKTRRSKEDKILVSIVFSPRLRISFYPNSLSFACSVLVRRFWLIVSFSSSCATAGDRQHWVREKKQKVSKLSPFCFCFKFPSCPFSNTPFSFCWYSVPISILPVGATDAGKVTRDGWWPREGEIAATPGEILGPAKKVSCSWWMKCSVGPCIVWALSKTNIKTGKMSAPQILSERRK